MTPLWAITARPFRLPAFRVSVVHHRGAARLYQPRSTCSKRYSNRQTPSQPSSPRVNKAEPSPAQAQSAPSSTPSIANALATAPPSENNLLAPVHIPEDPNAVLKENHPATSLLSNSGLVVQRQIEMMNMFLGFEQANRYVIMDPHGNHVGYMAEHDGGFGKVMGRQWLRTHRAFTTHVFSREQKEVLRFHRPFSLINSRIRIYDPLEPASSLASASTSPVNTSHAMVPGATEKSAQVSPLPLSDMRIIGEAQSQWAALKRKYNLFLFHQPPGEPGIPSPRPNLDLSEAQQAQVTEQSAGADSGQYVQFAYIEEPPLSWDFSLRSASDKLIGSVNRSFAGFAREIFTDTGVYALRMDAAGLEEEASKRHIISKTAQHEREYKDVVGGEKTETGMTLDQRAVMLATAVTVDYDYFSRHSHGGGMGMMPLWIGGGEAAEGGAAAEGAVGAAGAGEAGGAVVGGAGRAVGGVASGAGEGAIAGAGTMAGYEAMQRGTGGGGYGEQQQQRPQQPMDDASQQAPEHQPPPQQSEDAWGQQGDNSDGWGAAGGGNGAGKGEDVWGQGGQDPWSGQGGDVGSGGGGGGGGGSGWSIWDIFGE